MSDVDGEIGKNMTNAMNAVESIMKDAEIRAIKCGMQGKLDIISVACVMYMIHKSATAAIASMFKDDKMFTDNQAIVDSGIDIEQIAREALLKNAYPQKEKTLPPVLPELPDDFSQSKDWKEGDYADRVEWLMMMVKNQRSVNEGGEHD